MPVEGIYYDFRSDFWSNDASGSSWSTSINIPEATVYASAAVSQLVAASAIWCGIMSYKTAPDNNHVPSPQYNGVTPAIFAGNVIQITFGYNVETGSGDCNFAIFTFG